jgi:hypothetical protein
MNQTIPGPVWSLLGGLAAGALVSALLSGFWNARWAIVAALAGHAGVLTYWSYRQWRA